MNQETRPSSSPMPGMLLTFLAGAALGAVVLALVTPKSGPDLRGDLKDLADRARRNARDLSGRVLGQGDDLGDRARQASGDFQRGLADAVNDLGG